MSHVNKIPAYSLYGESAEFPDVLHCERIADRASLHDWHIAPHRHLNLHQIFLIESGHADMNLDGQSLELSAMTVVAVPPRSVHGFVFEQNTIGLVLSIPVNEVTSLTASHALLADFFAGPRVVPATAKVVNVLKTILTEHRAANCARIPLLRGLTLQLACYLADSAASDRRITSPSHEKITHFEQLARDHLTDHWKIANYAAALGISTTHLTRLCNDVMGQSPKAYLHSLVIQQAKQLLAYTQMDVASVGYRIGFEDPSYFSRAFMRSTGQSPRAFRNMYDSD
ncbi:MAG: helix-turn-helix domain-containing protein [Rhodobacteraceae bacterium]|nr:helix-turn-helix domain-containing protein [Paracoccaceae bacterium]